MRQFFLILKYDKYSKVGLASVTLTLCSGKNYPTLDYDTFIPLKYVDKPAMMMRVDNR